MISYFLEPTQNKTNYEELLAKSILELEAFFGFQLKLKPCLLFLKSRLEFNDICGWSTESWVTGYNVGNLIFLMEESVYEQESSKKLNPENYPLTITHEACHIFYRQLAGKNKPTWLSEGLSLFLSNQIKFRSRPDTFKNFLKFGDKNSVGQETVYEEAGFIVEKLVNKFSKEKLLELIKATREIGNDQQFKEIFSQIYGSELSYDFINKL